MTPLVFLDTETSGVHPGRRVWEVAMIRRDAAGERRVEFFVDVDLSDADPFGLSVGRFYERHPLGRKLSGLAEAASGTRAWASSQTYTEAAVAERVAQWTHGAHIVGSNPSFDTSTLEPMLRRHGLIPAWSYHLLDVGPMAYAHLLAKGETVDLPYSSNDLSERLGVPKVPAEKRHTAMGDVEWVMAMYDAMTGGAA